MIKDGVRINKFISDSGYCSRREADAYIRDGRVMINNKVADLGDFVTDGSIVRVDDERVGKKARKAVYIALNKPTGVTSTSDTSDRTNIIDFVGYKDRIFHIGRLDKDSEGLIFLTNDGDIVNKILRAGNNHVKEYVVWVDREITAEFIKKMSSGVFIGEATTKPCKIVKRSEMCFTIFLTQGLNRQIRRMCSALDYKVTRLKRVSIMNISLGNLKLGEWRYFTPQEVEDMHAILEVSVGTEEASGEKKSWEERGRSREFKPNYNPDKEKRSSKSVSEGRGATLGRGKPTGRTTWSKPGDDGKVLGGKTSENSRAVSGGKSGSSGRAANSKSDSARANNSKVGRPSRPAVQKRGASSRPAVQKGGASSRRTK